MNYLSAKVLGRRESKQIAGSWKVPAQFAESELRVFPAHGTFSAKSRSLRQTSMSWSPCLEV